MGDLVNLRRARKAQARAAKERTASANRARFGSSKVETSRLRKESERAGRSHAGARLDDPAASDREE
jgi:hypothetical protein